MSRAYQRALRNERSWKEYVSRTFGVPLALLGRAPSWRGLVKKHRRRT